jgi:DNA ligase-1
LLSLAATATSWAPAALAGMAGGRERTAVASPAPLLLASTYDERIDAAGCLVSEKYDGVRAWWDGQTLRHRSGRIVGAPEWFTARLPREALDGELWLGRGAFDELSGIVRSVPADDASWRRVRYMVFEPPGAAGSFAERVAAIERIVKHASWPQLQAVEHVRVDDRAGLQRRLDAVVAGGGEGLMLHLASALFVTGRSDVLTKLKPYLDAEATVVGYRAGHGKYDSVLGALQVRTPEGQVFFLGSGLPDAVRKHPPARGSVVTYRFRDRTPKGLPRFATFHRLHEAL